MFYRVDYVLALIVAGGLIGLACSRLRMAPARIARIYFATVLVLIGLRIALYMASLVQPHTALWNQAGAVVSDLGSVVFGFIFGLALRRPDRRPDRHADCRALLLHPAIFSAFCISIASGFALAGVAKSFSIDWMLNFFHQSGYSPAFLKCVIVTEIFAALALLIPATVMPAILVLAVDMFGAIYTHVHNGDPLNDSTGAIISLLHLAVVAILWIMRRETAHESASRRSYAIVAAGAFICCLIAVIGGVLMRHAAHP